MTGGGGGKKEKGIFGISADSKKGFVNLGSSLADEGSALNATGNLLLGTVGTQGHLPGMISDGPMLNLGLHEGGPNAGSILKGFIEEFSSEGAQQSEGSHDASHIAPPPPFQNTNHNTSHNNDYER